METYWCCKNNSIIDNYLNTDFNPALVPSIKEKCRRWKEGEVHSGCHHLIKAGKHHSEESRKMMSASQKRRQINEKQKKKK